MVNKRDKFTEELYGYIDTDYVYGKFLLHLNNMIHQYGRAKLPVISLENVKFIDAAVLPLLLVVGQILYKYYNHSIPLKLAGADNVKQFMYISDFYTFAGGFNTIGEHNACFLFNVDDASGYVYDKQYNPNNKLTKLQGMKGYYELSEEEKQSVKYRLQDEFMTFTVCNMFGKLMGEVLNEGSKVYYDCLSALSETMCNAVLYSLSDSYLSVQMLSKNEFVVSICDTGIGFFESLTRKGVNPIEAKRYIDEERAYSSMLDDFFAIFTALEHSERSQRTNLWKLVRIICESKGELCIHTGRTKVVFSNYVVKKNDNVYQTMNRILNEYSSDYRRSPLKLFDAKLRGVHIEIKYGKGNNDEA